nr:Ig-like domain-containing protein [Eubacterium sp.]
MRQIGTKSARYFKKIVTFVLAFAMIVTSLAVSSTESEAAKKKVKKVKIGVKVGGSGILVLKKGQKKKLNVSVTPKKASKKVSYKSSNKKVVSVNKKGVVKALKKKGSAKITVTSKQNKKKKATITVKIGTPAKKLTIQKTAEMKWKSANFTLIEKDGQKQKHYEQFNEKITLTNGAFQAQAGRTVTLKADFSPKNVTSKKVKWSANKGGTYVALIPSGRTCVVSLKRVNKKPTYDVKVTATAMDGSGKKSSVLIKVGEFQTDKTPAPTEAPDTRIKTMVENFESYPVGTTWDKYTCAGKNSGTMTVVADPENPDNKCLEIKYDGTDTAYDFAPVFNVDLAPLSDSTGKSAAGKTMSNYTAINADMRVVGDDGDVKYKTIYAYFDQYGAIQKSDKFAANDNKTASGHVDKDGNAVAAGSANEEKSLRFGVEISHATGSDVEVAKKLYNGNETKEKAKYMPAFYDSVWKEDKSTWFTKDSAMTGYKPFADASKYADGVVPNVGFASKSLTIDYSRVKELDATLPDQTKFDVVIGSTYAGTPTYSKINPPTSVTVYMDNISLSEETIPVTDFALSVDGEAKVAAGGDMTINVAYTPENTTQKGLTWTTNNDKVTVDAAGKVSAASDFVFGEGEVGTRTATVLVTATSVANPALTKTMEVTVYEPPIPSGDIIITPDMVDTTISNAEVVAGTDPNGVECFIIKFTGNNQRVFFQLPEITDLSGFKSVEIDAFAPAQMNFDSWDQSLDTTADKWYETDTSGTYPFYMGSHTIRPDKDITLEDFNKAYPDVDGSSYAVDGVIPKGTPIGELGRELAVLDLAEIKQGDWSKTKYVALGTNQVPDDDWEEVTYYFYGFKLVAKTAADMGNESGSVESPSTESATTEAATN